MDLEHELAESERRYRLSFRRRKPIRDEVMRRFGLKDPEPVKPPNHVHKPPPIAEGEDLSGTSDW